MTNQPNSPEIAGSTQKGPQAEIGQPRWGWINRVDRTRNRFLLFAGAAFVAVTWFPLSAWVISTWSTVIGRVPPSPSGPGGSLMETLSNLALLAPLVVITFPL